MKNNCVVNYGLLGLMVLFSGLTTDAAVIVSTVSVTNLAGAAASHSPSFSRDGRHLVFLSHANNLVTNDSNRAFLDVFRYDLATGSLTMASVSSSRTGGGDADSAHASISSDGRFVAFASAAGNLVHGDINNASDAFVRDMESQTTMLVSVGLQDANACEPNPVGNLFRSTSPVISDDGRQVVFESRATNLTTLSDTNGGTDIFIRNLELGTTRLASVSADGSAAGNARSELASMTQDARHVAFVSYATNLTEGVTNQGGEIYIRNLQTGTTVWASAHVAQWLPDYRCHAPAISSDGRAVAFKASVPDAANASVFHRDLSTGVTSLLHTNSPAATDVVISGDGSTVAFDDGEQVFLWQGGVTTLVSKRADGAAPANGNSTSPVLSFDGQIVAYVSTATDIVIIGVPATNTAHQIYVLNRQAGVTRLVTQNTNGVATMTSHQFAHVALSPDGTQIAFDSLASDLVPGDLNAASDVFITPVANNALTLISRRAESLPSLTGMRSVRIAPDCLSADGRHLLFASLPNAQAPGDANCCENLFIRDLVTGAEEQITSLGEARPKTFIISSDGAKLAYVVQSLNYSPSESVVFYDRHTRRQVFAHRDTVQEGYLNGSFSDLAFSPDGTLLSFLHSTGGSRNIYLFDSVTGSNRVITHSFVSRFPLSSDNCSPSRFSPDGRLLVFGSTSSLLTTNRQPGYFCHDINEDATRLLPAPDGNIFTSLVSVDSVSFSGDSRLVATPYFVHDLQHSTNFVLGTNPVARKSVLSANGKFAACFQGIAPFNGRGNLLVKNLQTGNTRTASTNATAFLNPTARCNPASLTPDGRYVIYTSQTNDSSFADVNEVSDIYARDLVRDTTMLLSPASDGTRSGSGASTMPILSADGRTILFQSFADDLVAGDFNFSRDVFIVHLGGPDSDGDQMDDDWEMVCFGTLSRSGTGDFDGDGASDLAEFKAGTDPTDLGSILRVITINSLNNGTKRLVWSASPGRTYRIQFKESVNDADWSELGASMTAVGTTASAVDESASAHPNRFYRVLLVP